MKIINVIILAFVLISCNDSNYSEEIILGFKLGMSKNEFYNHIKELENTGKIKNATSDLDRKRSLERFVFQINTTNLSNTFTFCIEDENFYNNKLASLSIFYYSNKERPYKDMQQIKKDLEQMYFLKYSDFKYELKYNFRNIPNYNLTQGNMQIEMTGEIYGIRNMGTNQKVFIIEGNETYDSYTMDFSVIYKDKMLIAKQKQEKSKLKKEQEKQKKDEQHNTIEELSNQL